MEYYEKPSLDELKHVGIIGMRWGTRRSQKHADTLSKGIDKDIRRFDRGSRRVSANTFRDDSRQVRKETYKANKRIARINRYLNRSKGESVNNILWKFDKDPAKVAKAKDYLARNQLITKQLSEIRSTLMDIKIDTL